MTTASDTPRASKPDLVVRSYEAPHSANHSKIDKIVALLPLWQDALVQGERLLLRYFYENGRLPRHPLVEGIGSPLSQRQLNSVAGQAKAAMQSWVSGMVPKFRELVAGSNLDDETVVLLRRINAAKAWFKRDFKLDKQFVPGHVMRMARSMVGHLRRTTHRTPRLGNVRTMVMDGKVAQLEKSKTKTFDFWTRISTATKRHSVRVPLTLTSYAAEATGDLSNHAQVIVGRDRSVKINLTKTSSPVQLRDAGTHLGLDWGLNAMFSTSEGQLLGLKLYDWLLERDRELQQLTACLQRQGIRLKTNRRYQALNHRIREYVTNEVGRIFNALAAREDLAGIVVEKLDFRHGGLSRRLNRIVTRAGRGAVKRKLRDLAETRGLTSTEVNPAYSSQQCSGCGFTHRLNRSGTLFRCRFCHKLLHADVNAARNLGVRRSDPATGGLYASKQKIKSVLDQRFHDYWNLDAGTDFDDLAGRGRRRRSSPRQVPAPAGLQSSANY